MKTQPSEILFRIVTAIGVVLVMLASIHGLASVSQQHISRTLAQYAAMEHAHAVQLAQCTPLKQV